MKMPSPDDNPSTPSIMLMALMIPTPENAHRGRETYTGNLPMPKRPWKSLMLTRSMMTTKPMTATSRQILIHGRMPTRSSMKPMNIITVMVTTHVNSA